MDVEMHSMLGSVISMFGGFVDLMVAVVMIGLAFTVVKKVEPKLGYVLGGVAGLRFLGTCCGRVASAGSGSISADVMSLMFTMTGFLRIFLDIFFFAGVVYVLMQLAKAATPES